jgi:DHA2 family methylenomycin A resistance protein-like MFS transporter
VLGGGIGLLVPPMTTTLMGSVDRSRSGIASGTLNMMRQTGSVLGVAVFGSLIAAKDRFTAGLHTSLLISIAAVAVAALVVWATFGAVQQRGASG